MPSVLRHGDGRLAWLVRPLLALQACVFCFFVAGTHGAFGPQPQPPTTTDFAGFYAAGLLANRHTPEAAYDATTHRAAEAEAVAPGVEEKRFLNPPVFLLFCAPLARLPYLVAFALFEVASFALWLALATRIAGGGSVAMLALACIPSVWWTLGWGQNAFLSASLMAAATWWLRRRPWLAGAAFGALCFKPHFGLLVPVALIAGRHWRALMAATLSAAGLCTLSAACFGASTWRAFLAVAAQARIAAESDLAVTAHVDLGGAARLLGIPATASWVIQGAAAAVAGLCVAWLWARAPAGRPVTIEREAAANAGLIAATLAAMPFVLFYDLVMAGVAAAWLARAEAGFATRSPDARLFATLAVLDLLAYPAALQAHLPVGALVAPALLWRAMQRAQPAFAIR